MHGKGGFAPILIILVAAAFLLAGGAWYYETNHANTGSSPTPVSFPVLSPSGTIPVDSGSQISGNVSTTQITGAASIGSASGTSLAFDFPNEITGTVMFSWPFYDIAGYSFRYPPGFGIYSPQGADVGFYRCVLNDSTAVENPKELPGNKCGGKEYNIVLKMTAVSSHDNFSKIFTTPPPLAEEISTTNPISSIFDIVRDGNNWVAITKIGAATPGWDYKTLTMSFGGNGYVTQNSSRISPNELAIIAPMLYNLILMYAPGWVQYKNPQYGFSFEYPFQKTSSSQSRFIFESNDPNSAITMISWASKPPNQSLLQWYSSRFDSPADLSIQSATEMNINGYKALNISYSLALDLFGGGPGNDLLLTKDSSLIIYFPGIDITSPDINPYDLGIISSFRFN